jgi:hypothetical protein
MKNKKILYGLLGIGAIAGFYFYFYNKNKNKMPKIYSKKCQDDLTQILQLEVVRPLNFSKDFLETCEKNEQNLAQIKN